MRILMAMAWRNLWRHRRRSLITATAMAVAVALCMALIAFTDGMYNKMAQIMVDQQLGHVQVHHPEYPAARQMLDTVPDAAQVLATIDGRPEVVGATGAHQIHQLLSRSMSGAQRSSTGKISSSLADSRLVQTRSTPSAS